MRSKTTAISRMDLGMARQTDQPDASGKIRTDQTVKIPGIFFRRPHLEVGIPIHTVRFRTSRQPSDEAVTPVDRLRF